MPVVLRIKGYQILFYALDAPEPPHVHVRRDRQQAKIWLVPALELAKNQGFKAHEITEIMKIIAANYAMLLESWHAYFRI